MLIKGLPAASLAVLLTVSTTLACKGCVNCAGRLVIALASGQKSLPSLNLTILTGNNCPVEDLAGLQSVKLVIVTVISMLLLSVGTTAPLIKAKSSSCFIM